MSQTVHMVQPSQEGEKQLMRWYECLNKTPMNKYRVCRGPWLHISYLDTERLAIMEHPEILIFQTVI